MDHFSDIENNIHVLNSDNAPSQLLMSDLDRLRMVCEFIGEQESILGFDPEFNENEQVLKEARWMALDELSERDRAFLWSAGLMCIPQFYEEIQNWSREVTCPKKEIT